MNRPRPRSILWTIGALAALALVVGGVVVNVRVLTRDESEPAGSLSPVVATTDPIEPAALAPPSVDPASVAASVAARRTAVRRRAAAVRRAKLRAQAASRGATGSITTPDEADDDGGKGRGRGRSGDGDSSGSDSSGSGSDDVEDDD